MNREDLSWPIYCAIGGYDNGWTHVLESRVLNHLFYEEAWNDVFILLAEVFDGY